MITDQVLLSRIKQSRVFNIRQNKSEILAALSSPINMKLKQQLVENLDGEYRSDKYTNPDEYDDTQTVDIDVNDESSDVSEDSDNKESTEKLTVDKSQQNRQISSDDESDDGQPDDADTNSDDEISESVDINTVSIIEEVKHLLNGDGDTDGVNYVQLSESSNVQDNIKEMWIYYNDNININGDMLSKIISTITSKYADWQFNRMARTYNAVIFVVNVDDVVNIE